MRYYNPEYLILIAYLTAITACSVNRDSLDQNLSSDQVPDSQFNATLQNAINKSPQASTPNTSKH